MSLTTFTRQTVRVHRMEWAAEDTMIIELRSLDGRPLPSFTAGSHIEVVIPLGITRAYSLANDPAESHRWVLGVVLEAKSRGGSRFLHRDLHVGDTIDVIGPHNHFELDEDDGGLSVLIAGGIGVTPILTMAYRLKALGRPFEFHYAVRTLARAAFLDEVRAVCGPALYLHIDADVGAPLDVQALVDAAPADSHFYCCGPLPMLKAFEAATVLRPLDCVHFEYFRPPPPPNTDSAFEVELASTGEVFVVPPGRSILEVLNAVGAYTAGSCTEGVCGACEVKVLSGIPDHRDTVLKPREKELNRKMMICVSRAKSERLVIDVD